MHHQFGGQKTTSSPSPTATSPAGVGRVRFLVEENGLGEWTQMDGGGGRAALLRLEFWELVFCPVGFKGEDLEFDIVKLTGLW